MNCVGSLSFGKAITFFQTCSGDAFISIDVVTERRSSLSTCVFSNAMSEGTEMNSRMHIPVKVSHRSGQREPPEKEREIWV
jgi:hypothetical protein